VLHGHEEATINIGVRFDHLSKLEIDKLNIEKFAVTERRNRASDPLSIHQLSSEE
jgi:hypothetical protein